MKYYVVDAFADKHFTGNPAGVCLLEKELDDTILQKIASENNLPETAFLLEKDNKYFLRWFTPEFEIDLCGHATLATSFVLMNYLDMKKNSVEFHTKSGVLSVVKENSLYIMDFPSRKPIPCPVPNFLEKAIGEKILEVHSSRDLLILVENESIVRELKPNIQLLSEIKDSMAVIVTAKGIDCDFVSRFFAPNAGIAEDPVTGSAHSTLIPFWAEKLNKNKMIAKQLSKRGGMLFCENVGERVKIAGKAICFSIGEILL